MVGYVVRYANEIRTIVGAPFIVDSTGEELPMDGSMEYELCDADEVEGCLGIEPINTMR